MKRPRSQQVLFAANSSDFPFINYFHLVLFLLVSLSSITLSSLLFSYRFSLMFFVFFSLPDPFFLPFSFSHRFTTAFEEAQDLAVVGEEGPEATDLTLDVVQESGCIPEPRVEGAEASESSIEDAGPTLDEETTVSAGAFCCQFL
jgi:hypothetical protein